MLFYGWVVFGEERLEGRRAWFLFWFSSWVRSDRAGATFTQQVIIALGYKRFSTAAFNVLLCELVMASADDTIQRDFSVSGLPDLEP